jgi:dolichol kinase
VTPPRPPDLRDLERDILAAAERARIDAQELADRLRGDVQTAAERVRSEAQAAGARVAGEAPRKAIHLASIAIPLAILHLPMPAVRRSLVVLAVALLVADLVKIHHPRWRSVFTTFFGPLIRRHEHTGITGSTYMVVSALLATYLFDRPTAAGAMVFLIVGDTLAAMVGMAWGRTRFFDKSFEGFLAGFLSSWAAAALLVPELPPGSVAVGALIGAFVEVLPIPVDDNFRIPLLAGLVLQWAR